MKTTPQKVLFTESVRGLQRREEDGGKALLAGSKVAILGKNIRRIILTFPKQLEEWALDIFQDIPKAL